MFFACLFVWFSWNVEQILEKSSTCIVPSSLLKERRQDLEYKWNVVGKLLSKTRGDSKGVRRKQETCWAVPFAVPFSQYYVRWQCQSFFCCYTFYVLLFAHILRVVSVFHCCPVIVCSVKPHCFHSTVNIAQ